jgi:uncharacterized repeat protein (TIGR01451 family)
MATQTPSNIPPGILWQRFVDRHPTHAAQLQNIAHTSPPETFETAILAVVGKEASTDDFNELWKDVQALKAAHAGVHENEHPESEHEESEGKLEAMDESSAEMEEGVGAAGGALALFMNPKPKFMEDDPEFWKLVEKETEKWKKENPEPDHAASEEERLAYEQKQLDFEYGSLDDPEAPSAEKLARQTFETEYGQVEKQKKIAQDPTTTEKIDQKKLEKWNKYEAYRTTPTTFDKDSEIHHVKSRIEEEAQARYMLLQERGLSGTELDQSYNAVMERIKQKHWEEFVERHQSREGTDGQVIEGKADVYAKQAYTNKDKYAQEDYAAFQKAREKVLLKNTVLRATRKQSELQRQEEEARQRARQIVDAGARRREIERVQEQKRVKAAFGPNSEDYARAIRQLRRQTGAYVEGEFEDQQASQLRSGADKQVLEDLKKDPNWRNYVLHGDSEKIGRELDKKHYFGGGSDEDIEKKAAQRIRALSRKVPETKPLPSRSSFKGHRIPSSFPTPKLPSTFRFSPQRRASPLLRNAAMDRINSGISNVGNTIQNGVNTIKNLKNLASLLRTFALFTNPTALVIIGIIILILLYISLFSGYTSLNITATLPEPTPTSSGTQTTIPGLTLTLTGPTAVANSENISYTIEASYTGTAEVTLSDPLPANTTFVSATGTYTNEGNTIIWKLAENEGGDTSQKTYTFTLVLHPETEDIEVKNKIIANAIGGISTGSGTPVDKSTEDFDKLMTGQGRNVNILGDENSFVAQVMKGDTRLQGQEDVVRKIYKKAVSQNVNPLIILTLYGEEAGFTSNNDTQFGCKPFGSGLDRQLSCSVNTWDNWMTYFEKNKDANGTISLSAKCVYSDAFLFAAEKYGPRCVQNDNNDHFTKNFVHFFKKLLG